MDIPAVMDLNDMTNHSPHGFIVINTDINTAAHWKVKRKRRGYLLFLSDRQSVPLPYNPVFDFPEQISVKVFQVGRL